MIRKILQDWITCSPCPLLYWTQMTWNTRSQRRFPPRVSTTSPTFTPPFLSHSAWSCGPASLLNALPHGFESSFKVSPVVLTRTSAYIKMQMDTSDRKPLRFVQKEIMKLKIKVVRNKSHGHSFIARTKPRSRDRGSNI